MADNSPIQASGIGKNSKRHDLSGTPGLNSDLQYGEVSELEAGQRTLSQQPKAAPVAGVQPAPVGPAPGLPVPDPMTFAKEKLAGTAANGMAGGNLNIKDMSRWVPVLERLAMSPTSSGVLQAAYVNHLSQRINKPLGGRTTVVRQRDLDARLQAMNERQ